jgi:outer membrane biosynthesis protein TonB
MELMISGDFAEKILSLLKKDKGLATSLAGEWLERVDNAAIAEYLLTREIATDLLASRLVTAPEQTVEELQALAAGKTVKAAPVKARRKATRKAAKKATKKATAKKATKKATAKKTTKKAAKKATKKAVAKKTTKKAVAKKATRKATKKVAKKPARAGIQRRTRLPKDQIAGLKSDVVRYLGSVAAASRKQIIEASGIPTPAIYNRIVGELREEGMVGSEGQKAKAVYFLKKGKRKAKGRKRR